MIGQSDISQARDVLQMARVWPAQFDEEQLALHLVQTYRRASLSRLADELRRRLGLSQTNHKEGGE